MMMQGLLPDSVNEKIYKWRHKNQLTVWHEVIAVYAVVFLVWGIYRWLSPFSLWFEELVLKGLVFGLPAVWMGIRRHGWSLVSMGLTSQRLFKSVYLGLGLGLSLGLVGELGNYFRYGQIQFSDYGLTSEMVGGFLLLALVTAFWEGLFFYGYALQMINTVSSELVSITTIGFLYMLIHIPGQLHQQLTGGEMIKALILLLTLGIANSILMLRMKNLAAPILTQVVWGVTIFLFR
jgi:hypothetical protein